MSISLIIISSTDESSSSSIAAPPSASTQKSPTTSLCRFGSDGGGANEAESSDKKLPTSRYKGVVPQANGRWGAQIYEKHQRVWLGTFVEEEEAARSYDVAAQCFRGHDTYRNFTPVLDSEADESESFFIRSHSKWEIVDMLRKHIYSDELEQSRQNFDGNGNAEKREQHLVNNNPNGVNFGNELMSTEVMFEKMVTPSDVGKLNRLVIPKHNAEKHFPLQSDIGSSAAQKGLLLTFKDLTGKVWRFRYSYWNSSQSYVLTKGWSRFVKEMNLVAGDIIRFHRSLSGDEHYIDFISQSRENPSVGDMVSVRSVDSVTPPPVQADMPVFRLFGIDIVVAPENVSGGGEKRMREMELLSKESNKKTRVIGTL